MSTNLVKQRKFQRTSKHTIKTTLKKVKLIHPQITFPIKYFWITIIMLLFSYGIFFIIRHTLLKPENYIQNLSYSKESYEKYDDPYLYKTIGGLLKGENFFVVSELKRKDILRSLQRDFPMIKNIKIVKSAPYSASVWIDFYIPDIIIQLGDRRFAVLGDYSFEIYSGNTIGDNMFYMELPLYLSGINSLYGLFHEISAEKLIHDMSIVSENFPGYQRIVYLPGSSMIAVIFEGLRVYLNDQNSLLDQISNFHAVKQYYKDFDSIKIIDLGSLQGDKIIIQK